MNRAGMRAKAPRTVVAAAKKITEISSLPHVMMQVMDVVNDSNSTAADLQRVVESDPSLMARILRIVNSARYSLKARVENVHRAVCLLGFNEVWKLAVTASIADQFKDESAIGRYTRPALWRHMVSVAAGARLVASRAGLASFEKAFLAGLLHDFGLILLDQYVHVPFKRLILSLRDDSDFAELERTFIGFSHSDLGEHVGRQWHFPDSVLDTIRYHHRSEQCRSPHRPIVQAVEVANFIVSAKSVTSVGRHLVARPSEATLAALSLDRLALKVLWDDFDAEVKRFESMLDV